MVGRGGSSSRPSHCERDALRPVVRPQQDACLSLRCLESEESWQPSRRERVASRSLCGGGITRLNARRFIGVLTLRPGVCRSSARWSRASSRSGARRGNHRERGCAVGAVRGQDPAAHPMPSGRGGCSNRHLDACRRRRCGRPSTPTRRLHRPRARRVRSQHVTRHVDIRAVRPLTFWYLTMHAFPPIERTFAERSSQTSARLGSAKLGR
jgi:hypothetical protein